MTDYSRDEGSASVKLSAWGGLASDGTLDGPNGLASGSPVDQFGSFQGTTLNDIRPTPAASGSLSIVGSGNNDNYFTLIFDDAVEGVSLSYATRGTSTGFDTHWIEYSTDGGTSWTALENHLANKTSTFQIHTVTIGDVFASTSGSETNLIKIKVSGATGTGGNNRFDNILVTGDIVPEPATIGLLALGGLFLRRRRV